MRVLLESTSFFELPPKSYAGTEAVVYNLAVELNKLGHKVSVAAPIGSTFPAGIEHIQTVQPQFGQMLEDQGWPIVRDQLVNPQTGQVTGKFDIIHCNSFRMWPYMAAKDHPELKTCATVHWTMHWPQVGAGLPPVKNPNLIGISNAHALACSRALGRHFEYVYNGIDIDSYTVKKEKGDRFLFLGRIARFKGPHEAIHLANEYRFPIDVAGEDRFVGDPTYVQQVMDACKTGMGTYLGEISHERKRELLQNAKAVILPYAWPEPFGIVPVEANACGTPAIGLDYDGSAMREIIQDGVNGFLCKSLKEMGEATKNVGDIKPEECRRVVEEKFTARKMTEAYLALYQRILDGKEW